MSRKAIIPDDWQIKTPAKRKHDAADPRKCLENALRILTMVPRIESGLCPHPLDTVAAEIKQAMQGM